MSREVTSATAEDAASSRSQRHTMLLGRLLVARNLAAASAACACAWAPPARAAAPDPAAAPPRKFRVGVIGATGAVGQRFLEALDGHPWFEVTALGASARSEGKVFNEAAWQLSADVPACARGKILTACSPAAMPDVDLVFSALVRGGKGDDAGGDWARAWWKPGERVRACHHPPPRPPSLLPCHPQDADVAGTVEVAFRDAGVPVFSNARNFRMDADVPLVVPPVNGDHLELVRRQPSFSKGGFIVTNSNCSTTGLVIALKPLHDAFGIESATVTTLQAISGAGYPGLPSLDILDNVVPHISGEEDKLESEYKKILGVYDAGAGAPIAPASFPVSAMVNRVHVRDGHSLALSLKLRVHATPAQVAAVLRGWRPVDASLARAPSAPAAFIQVREEVARPQPRLDRDAGRGYTTTIGSIRADPVNTVKMFVVTHNTIMGAAGSSLLNAELAVVKGLVKHRG